MKKFLLILVLFSGFGTISLANPTELIGWASVNANGQNGTTGGEGGLTVRVSTLADLVFQAQRTETLTILIEGMLDLTTQTGTGRYVFIHSNKTIAGAQPGSGIRNGGFRIRSPHRNIIFRNLNITDSPEDGIQINGEIHHVWIDRCTFMRPVDGALDITNGANYITVSYCLFTDLNRASLISASDDDVFGNLGRYKITFHHNWFRSTTQRNPRVRFGQVHVFNNYYTNVSLYGIGIGNRAHIISENNFFDTVLAASRFYDDALNQGFFVDTGSILHNSGNFVSRPIGINWNPANHYQYTLTETLMVPQIVMANAGAEQTSTHVPITSEKSAKIQIAVFPNPITEVGHITIQMPYSARVKATLFDISGRKISVLANEVLAPGHSAIPFDRKGLSSGVYFLKIEAGTETLTQKVLIR